MSQANGQSLQSDLLDAVVAALGGEAANVWRCRFQPFGPAELPAINVIPDEEQALYEIAGQRETHFRFKVRHMAATTDAVDKVVDLAYVAAEKLLLADPTFAGLVRMTRHIGGKWEFEDATLQQCAFAITYEAEFSTKRNDPSTPGL
jgi:hypothetical protein